MAIRTTLNQVNYGKNLVLNTKNSRRKILDIYATQQILTLVSYPVAMHQDCTGILPCFENKKCFVLDGRKNDGVGRGGGGLGKFVFALLDWAGNRPGGSRYDYLAATGLRGDQVPRVMRQMWLDRFGFTHAEFRQQLDNENVEGRNDR